MIPGESSDGADEIHWTEADVRYRPGLDLKFQQIMQYTTFLQHKDCCFPTTIANTLGFETTLIK